MKTNVIAPAAHKNAAPATGRLHAAREACKRIAPLWPLQSFVAVNPFVGLTERPFADACGLFARLMPGGMQMNADYYRTKWDDGRITSGDLAEAVARVRQQQPSVEITAERAQSFLRESNAPGAEIVATVVEALDLKNGTQWGAAIAEQIGQFCAAYFDEAQAAWKFPWKRQPLFAAWREFAQLDASLELMGAENFRARVAMLPSSAAELIELGLNELAIPQRDAADFLHKQLLTIRGWAGHVQYRVRGKAIADGALLELLAIRFAYDLLLFEQFDGAEFREFWPQLENADPAPAETTLALVWQVADELAWQRELTAKIFSPSAIAARAHARPAVQAIFCIDVRSEVFRRALEAASPKVATLGFAGFFGMPIEHVPFGEPHGHAQCPVLLTPKFRVGETLRAGKRHERAALNRLGFTRHLQRAWNSFKNSAVSCFSFVETAGVAFAPALWRDAFALCDSAAAGPLHAQLAPDISAIPLPDRVALAAGALRNMGLTKNFARLVLLCGHGSATTNNPYAAGLDCGACGGHAGDVNARVAAAIMNDAEVRAGLSQRGLNVPDDTWFIAGLHNTTTDEVTLFDHGVVPTSHREELRQLELWLEVAGRAARRERAASLGITAKARVDDEVAERSRDWSQVRPEWGLAGNAAFIAAPRARTQHANLGGRVFLHSYDWRDDADNSTLELILTAPVMVANWINLQYFASTVNNAVFGSGNKVLHNVVGSIGVCLGNGGDLQTGLPLQSVHDGEKWVHEPLRLHVIIEAPLERIDAVLAKHESVRRLVENEWLLLFAIAEDGQCLFRRRQHGMWELAAHATPDAN